jgi:hypothetical protein
MNTKSCALTIRTLAVLIAAPAFGQINWEAFNDHRIGGFTSPNATGWEMRLTGSGGPLRDILTGLDLPVNMTVEEEGGPSDDFGANSAPDPGTPADLFFANKVTIGGVGADGIVGVRSSLAGVVRLRFTNLNPTKRYKFVGTVCRGRIDYVDRWSVFKIVEAAGAAAAHVDASPDLNLFTAATFPDGGLLEDEVALNSGNNLPGSLVVWDQIDPGKDGTFAIEARQFVGLAPFGVPIAGPYGYSFNAMYLAEVEPGTGGTGSITNVSTVGGQLQIEWTGSGALESSPNLTSWMVIPGATSPYLSPMTESRYFFRLR